MYAIFFLILWISWFIIKFWWWDIAQLYNEAPWERCSAGISRVPVRGVFHKLQPVLFYSQFYKMVS